MILKEKVRKVNPDFRAAMSVFFAPWFSGRVVKTNKILVYLYA
jgi:hypothetical protein